MNKDGVIKLFSMSDDWQTNSTVHSSTEDTLIDDIYLSVIVCATNTSLVEKEIKPDLAKLKSEKLELVTIDNNQNRKFSCISKAYNYGANISHGRILMFIHQDVKFNDILWYKQLLNYCKTTDFGLIGSCGVSQGKIYYSDRIVTEKNKGLRFYEPMKASIVDEPIIVVKRETFDKYQFDEKTIVGFHLCAAEYSLRMRKHGLDVILFPINFSHYNHSSLTPTSQRNHMKAWLLTAKLLKAKYPKDKIQLIQGKLTNLLLAVYFIYYIILMGVFPSLIHKIGIVISKNPTLARNLNRILRGFE